MSAKNDDPCLNTNPSSEPSTEADANSALVRLLNCRLRGFGSRGQALIADGIRAEGFEFAQKADQAAAQFDSFDDDNDPWQEHDCTALTVDGRRIIWKMGYYGRQLTNCSPNPADTKVTRLVLTIMLASEY